MRATAQTREGSSFPSCGLSKAQRHVQTLASLDFPDLPPPPPLPTSVPFADRMEKKIFFFFSTWEPNRFSTEKSRLSMETVLILALPHLMPTQGSAVLGQGPENGEGEQAWKGQDKHRVAS